MRAQDSEHDFDLYDDLIDAARFASRPKPERRQTNSPRFAKAKRPSVSNTKGIHCRRNKRFYC